MCGGTLGQLFGFNVEQAEKYDPFVVLPAAARGTQSLDPGALVEGMVSNLYGSSDDEEPAKPVEDLTPEVAMTPEERQNRLRRLMASRYGRSQTVLTGGTGISDFGI